MITSSSIGGAIDGERGESAGEDRGELPERTDDILKSMIDCNSKKCSKRG